jgi:PadR family transcriptional regulator, regulatory protein PadR
MSGDINLTHTSSLILQIIGAGSRYGFDIMDATGLPSGTVYPALRRLEQLTLIQSRWEKESKALAEQRPARKYYKLTALGEKTLAKAVLRYPLLQHLKGARS